jgi:protein-glutamine gamma-glutamyltransferase
MTLPLLQRRLNLATACAALGAFGAGAGLLSPHVLLGALAFGTALFWRPRAPTRRRLHLGFRAASIGLLVLVLYVALFTGGDYFGPVLALLLVIAAGEGFRELEARNEMRFHLLSLTLLVASTAYYPGPVFALFFVAFVAAATLALMVGHLRRTAERFGAQDVRVGRSFLAATAALSLITIVMSVTVFLLFPRLQRNFVGLSRAVAGSMVGFGNEVYLGSFGGRISANPRIVFRVEFDGPLPPDLESLHWRGRSYDHFDGLRWTRSRALAAPLPPGRRPNPVWPGSPLLGYRIYGGPPGADVLFGIHPILDLEPRSAIRIVRDRAGDFGFLGSDQPTYAALSLHGPPPPDVLRGAREEPVPFGDPYLQLPALDPRVRALADSLTRTHTTLYDRARAVERWLGRELSYTLDLPASRRETSLEHFLFVRRAGHCEYFSTAMVVLLRSAGIPARNVTGFLGGEWSRTGGYLAVTQNQAHSWVEVRIPGYGWIPFDPTPAGESVRAAGAGAATSWAWPLRFWLDGLEHRWYKWVIFFDLDKQIGIFRSVSDGLGRASGRVAGASRWGDAVPSARVIPWVAAALAVGVLLRRSRRPGAPVTPETRTYLALRGAYRRAGYGGDPSAPPLRFLAELERQEAPGREGAATLVDAYLRHRFGGLPAGAADRARMRAGLAEARSALRKRRARRMARASA